MIFASLQAEQGVRNIGEECCVALVLDRLDAIQNETDIDHVLARNAVDLVSFQQLAVFLTIAATLEDYSLAIGRDIEQGGKQRVEAVIEKEVDEGSVLAHVVQDGEDFGMMMNKFILAEIVCVGEFQLVCLGSWQRAIEQGVLLRMQQGCSLADQPLYELLRRGPLDLGTMCSKDFL